MALKILQSTDIIGGTFSISLMAMMGTTVLLFLGTGWVSKRWKLPVALAGVVTLIAALHYYDARTIWLAAGQMPTIYRYIDWLITIPLQIVTLYFFIGATATLTAGLFWRLLIVAIMTILARYMGEVGFVNATLGFLLGLAGWLYILGEVFFGKLDEINAKQNNDAVKQGFFWLRLIVTVGWAIYPLTNFVASFAGGLTEGRLSIVYNLSDFVNQIAFGLIILTVAMRESISAR